MYERLSQVITEAGYSKQIIFVNDGSPDDSGPILEELAARDPEVVVITHSRPFGSQSAFSSGLEVSTGDACILLDGDLQDPPEVIPEFISKWKEGFDVVYGVRTEREARLHMRFFFKAFYRVFRKLSYLDVPVDAGDFSLLDRSVVNQLNALPEKHRFIRGLRAWVGFKQVGVPYHRPERAFGKSTNNLFRNLGWAQRAIFSFSYAPINLIPFIAVPIVLLSLLAIIVQVVARIIDPGSTPPGLTTVIILVLFLGGVQLLCLFIIGAYLAHIYEEVKGRPAFIVTSVLNDPTRPARGEGLGTSELSGDQIP